MRIQRHKRYMIQEREKCKKPLFLCSTVKEAIAFRPRDSSLSLPPSLPSPDPLSTLGLIKGMAEAKDKEGRRVEEEDGPRRKRDSPAQGRFRSQKHSGKMLQSSIVDVAYMYVYAAHFSRKWNRCFEGHPEERNALVQIKLITSSTHSLSPPHRPKKSYQLRKAC